jgi:hypothetical protein
VKKKQKRIRLSEHPEEKAQPPPGRLYGNDILKRRVADRANWRMIVRPYDLPAGRAEIFLASHKMKTRAGKTLLKFVLWFLNVSECKFNKPKAQSLRPKTY